MIKKTLLTILTIAFLSCNTTEADLPSKADFNNFSEQPYIVGKITHIGTKNIGEESFLEVLVEENPNVYEGDKTSFLVSESTEILKQKRNGNLETFPESGLKKHQIVGAWTTGTVMLSYPGQTGAKRIVVVD